MKSTRPDVIIIHETVAKSWFRDLSTFALFAGLIGIGWLMGSSAMQWMGAIIAFLTIAVKASGAQAKSRKSIAEARQFLDDLEAGHA